MTRTHNVISSTPRRCESVSWNGAKSAQQGSSVADSCWFSPHICITSRDARPQLVEIADLITEMTLVKHSYGAGYKAQRGVEF